MNHITKFFIIAIMVLSLPTSLFAWDWKAALNKDWQAVSQYRAKNFTQAFQQFIKSKTSDGQYNAGNAAAFMGRYQEAIAAYDKAIALNSHNSDAVYNRDIVKKLMNKKQQQKQQNKQNKQNKQGQQQQNKQPNNDQNKQQDKNQDKNNSQQNSQNNNNKKQNSQANQQNKPNQQDQQKQQDQQNQPKNQPNSQNQKQQNQQQSQQPQAKNNSQLMNQPQNQDEGKKQLLRRLAEDPGGLLKQKFLRDYMNRHSVEESSDQGDN